MWITLSSNLLRSPRILKQTTPTCSNLRDGVPRYFPAKPEVCDLGSHFTKDAAEDLLLPTWQGDGFTTREGYEGFFPSDILIFERSQVFWSWSLKSSWILVSNKNLEDMILFSAVSLKNYVILKMSFWISLNSPVFPYLWLTPSFTIWNEKSYLLGKVQLAFRANQSCRNWCRCLWTIRRADSTVGRQHT